jgi:hypothetical protein
MHRIERFALAEIDPGSGKPTVLTRDEIRAIEILLDRCIPKMATVSHTGPDGSGPVVINVITGVPRAPGDE